ncbi:hypothetical protein R3P38DRAFT_2812037 [Favolaschia claudopus]|uniref:Uncharacterized protein n=1 Tax=Favolaschia claudopus TaxID=2862362 RepID=A0AAV9Z8A7_9AGAR
MYLIYIFRDSAYIFEKHVISVKSNHWRSGPCGRRHHARQWLPNVVYRDRDHLVDVDVEIASPTRSSHADPTDNVSAGVTRIQMSSALGQSQTQVAAEWLACVELCIAQTLPTPTLRLATQPSLGLYPPPTTPKPTQPRRSSTSHKLTTLQDVDGGGTPRDGQGCQ